MFNPLVSICVPTCNRASFLERSLAGILRQDYPAVEILARRLPGMNPTKLQRILHEYLALVYYCWKGWV